MEAVYALLLVAAVVIVILITFFAIRIFRSRPVGSICNTNSDCNAGLVCDNSLRVCRAPIGTRCNTDNDCTNNSVCLAGVCTLRTTPITTEATTTNTTPAALPSPSMPVFSPVIFSYEDSTSSSSKRDWSTESSSDSDHSSESESKSTSSTTCSSEKSTSDFTLISDKDYASSLSKESTPTSVQLSGLFSTAPNVSKSMSVVNEYLLDIHEYQGTELKLLKTGEIVYGKLKHKSNLPLTRLEVVKNKIFALSRGSLVQLKMETLSMDTLQWGKVTGTPKNILHTSATRDGSYLWLQLKNEGFLLDNNGKVVEKVAIPNLQFIRNYGQTAKYYIDSYPEKNTVLINMDGEKLEKECAYAIFDFDADGIVTCSAEDWQVCRDIRLTKQSSYLISR